MAKFKQKAVEVEARQYIGGNGKHLADWINAEGGIASWLVETKGQGLVLPEQLYLGTTAGEIALNVSDWIVKIDHVFYNYTHDQFQQRFEQA